MPVQTPFRITPSLGPDLWQTALQFHWDLIAPLATTPSPQLGSQVTGNDAHTYILCKAAAELDADEGVSINTTTWVATADASDPVAEAPVAVAADAFFWARRIEAFS